jgi:ABC-2 type transport system ATP-binding protein
MGEMNTLLNNQGYVVYGIKRTHKDLENLFLSITQNNGMQ